MTIWQRIAKMFGVQYVMLRNSHHLTFRIKRAYCISGRYYTRSIHRKDSHALQDPGSTIPKGQAFYMLTNTTRLSKAVTLDPGTMVMSHDLWIPLTDKVDAGVSMYD